MPRYEYHCEACDATFEVTQRMSDEPLETCTCCEAGPVKRLISAGNGVIFKGSGFYQTDYKAGSKGTETKTAAEPAKTDAAAKTESTPAPAASTSGGSCGSGGCPSCS